MWPHFTVVLVLGAIAGIVHAQSAGIAVTVTDDAGRPVADAVVVAVPADGSVRLPARARQEIDQVDLEFLPRVQAVLAGTVITFPNRDNVRHQVYSFSPPKRFELPLYTGVPEPVVFDKPGIVVLGCNIHDWMVGYVYVSESPWFARTNVEGRALLTDLPPRAYVVRVWHPQLEAAEDTTKRNIDVARARTVDAAWSLKLTPETKLSRPPAGAGSRQY